MTWLFLAHLGATLYMTGLIWFVQIVHYPLFRLVGDKHFPLFEKQHTWRTGWVVGPVMVLELVTALVLLWQRPATIGVFEVWLGTTLLGIIWTSTVLVQMPLHFLLQEQPVRQAKRDLVWSNWVRTGAWSVRALLVLYWSAQLMTLS